MPETVDPAARLAVLLESLPPDERQEIVAWLLGTGRVPAWPGVDSGVSPGIAGTGVLGAAVATYVEQAGSHARLRRLGAHLPAAEGSQLVTIRLPSEQHARLRDWCAEHGFTMATVMRGLVERFLTQEGSAPPAETNPAQT